jgi:hypothetical protein
MKRILSYEACRSRDIFPNGPRVIASAEEIENGRQKTTRRGKSFFGAGKSVEPAMRACGLFLGREIGKQATLLHSGDPPRQFSNV